MINNMGNRMMAIAEKKCLGFCMSKPKVLISFDTANAVANLANSAGCNLSGPSTIQEREPLISWGLNIVRNSKSSSTAYMT